MAALTSLTRSALVLMGALSFMGCRDRAEGACSLEIQTNCKCTEEALEEYCELEANKVKCQEHNIMSEDDRLLRAGRCTKHSEGCYGCIVAPIGQIVAYGPTAERGVMGFLEMAAERTAEGVSSFLEKTADVEYARRVSMGHKSASRMMDHALSFPPVPE